MSSAVQLRFDIRHSPSLPADVRRRAERLAGRRLTNDGVIVLVAQRHRSQERNREDALARLVELLREATIRPKPRTPTRPTLASKRRRLDSKTRRAKVKRHRSVPDED